MPGSALGTPSSHGPLDAVDDSIPCWSCIAEVYPVEIWVFEEKTLELSQRVENWCPELGFLRSVSCVWFPEFDFLTLVSYVWFPTCGFLSLVSCVWFPEFGFLSLVSCVWFPAFGFLPLVS